MCIATLIPANVDVPWDGLENGSYVNDDGHGWAVASAEYGLQVGKSMKFYEAAATFREAREQHGPGSIALFHSRMATHGVLDEFNVHPFWVGEGEQTVVAHNGILPSHWHPTKGDRRSDTRILAERTLPMYLNPETGLPSRRKAAEIGRAIGVGNKLVILSVASGVPKARIINASQGIHERGVWFSNDWFRPYKNSFYTPYSSGKWASRADRQWWDEEERKWNESEKDTPVAFYSESPCEICGARDSVDLDSEWCDECDNCLACWNNVMQCSCKWWNRKRNEELAEQDAAEHKAALADVVDIAAWAQD